MASTVDTTSKYAILFASSLGLWLIPVSIKAPRLVVMGSFVASMGGFLQCFHLATKMGEEQHLSKRDLAQSRELIDYRFALQEIAAKEQLKLQFVPQQQTVTVPAQAIASQPASQPTDAIKAKLQRIASLPEHLELILDCSIENGGSITVRQAMRFAGLANKYKAEEIKAFFYELQEQELGTVSNDSEQNNRLVFTLASDLQELVNKS